MLRSLFRNLSKMKPPNNAATLLHDVDIPIKKATFGMGCFWSNDSLFGALPGVVRTRVGYSGGTTKNPAYRRFDSEERPTLPENHQIRDSPLINDGVDEGQASPVTSVATSSKSPLESHVNISMGDHTEVIEIDYDPKQITYQELLDMFWENHEYGLTTRIKRQYMSLILFHEEEQRALADASYSEVQRRTNAQLRTEIAPAGPFYPAEDYHQKYRLQGHKDLCSDIGLNSGPMLQTSHLAARLNGYLVGAGGLTQFEQEVEKLGLSPKQAEYVRRELERNAGGGLMC